MTNRYDGLPAPETFRNAHLQSTFGKSEFEAMAEQIVAYCIDAGTWDVRPFQFERLAHIADIVDSEVMNGGIENNHYTCGLGGLKVYGWIDDVGLTRGFVQRLMEKRTVHEPTHPIVRRVHAAVAAIARARDAR